MHEAQAALSNGDLYPPLFFSSSVLVNVYTVTPDLRPVNHKVSRKKPRTEASKVRLVVIAGWKKTIKESERARYRRARQLGGSLFRLDPLERSEASWSCTLDVFSLCLSVSAAAGIRRRDSLPLEAQRNVQLPIYRSRARVISLGMSAMAPNIQRRTDCLLMCAAIKASAAAAAARERAREIERVTLTDALFL